MIYWAKPKGKPYFIVRTRSIKQAWEKAKKKNPDTWIVKQ